MGQIRVKKEKVIKEFREELKRKIKNNDARIVYDKPFFQILNTVYPYHPKEIKCTITESKNLCFLIIKDHTYIYLEWMPLIKKLPVLLSITKMRGEFEDAGIGQYSLTDALKKIDKLWT